MNHETVLDMSIASDMVDTVVPKVASKNGRHHSVNALPEILFITSYPPRECGIATYSQDLFKSLNNKFERSFSLKVCALESGILNYAYPDEVKCVLDTSDPAQFDTMAQHINKNKNIHLVMVQHEFGFFQDAGDAAFLQFLYTINKPAIVAFHTVLPQPNETLKEKVWHIAAACESIVVMTKNAAQILSADYGVPAQKIVVIPHGTHLVPHLNKEALKEKYGLNGRKVMSTFGLLSSGKGIETTLNALPAIIEVNPDAMFLIIGKTHPGIVKSEGEKYRNTLEQKVEALQLQDHVKFINHYIPLEDLLEYLQLTDIYLFTSIDPNQAVSGTFSYAMSCGCPIISTPIPHAREVLREDTGIIIDFQNPQQLTGSVNRLLGDDQLREAYASSTLQRIVPTAWENSAITHALLLQKVASHTNRQEVLSKSNGNGSHHNGNSAHTTGPAQGAHNGHSSNYNGNGHENISLHYSLPAMNLDHLKKMTTDVGMIQFSKINQPDLESGFTLDDNARALIAMCMHFELTRDKADLAYIRKYVDFIKFCQKPEGYFLNYVDSAEQFTEQNYETNLADSNGRAIWALGFVVSKSAFLPAEIVDTAREVIQKALPRMKMVHSTRAMAFTIKGLYYSNLENKSAHHTTLIKTLANRLVQMYRHESEHNWLWFESYLTYANSILPEALLCAWLETGEQIYKDIAKSSFDFLLSLTFNENGIKVISNKSWMQKGQEIAEHGEQPIDVAYTILALSKFYQVFKLADYAKKMATAFNWFLGHNHLHQIIYNPCTGGCYDGLEDTHVNLNQGAESTVSYLMARCTMEKK